MKKDKIMKQTGRSWIYLFALLAAIIFALTMHPEAVKAAEATDANGITWTYNTISGGTGVEIKLLGDIPDTLRGKVTVPSTIGGQTVTRLADYAFYDNQALTTVTLPSTITSIGKDAFKYCGALKTCSYTPANVTAIGEGAFGHCTKLQEFTLPTNSNYTIISANLFSHCEKLSAITIPSQVYRINDYAFDSSGLQRMVIPNTVSFLGKNIFQSCNKLTSVTLPTNADVIEVPEKTFYSCALLKTVNIPSGYESIGTNAFSYSGLVGIYLPATITDIEAWAFYDCGDLEVVQFASVSVPAFAGEGTFKYTSETLKILTPTGMAQTYKTALVDADNTLGIPKNAEFLAKTERVTVIPKLSGSITVDGTAYAGQTLSVLTLKGTFLNALTNEAISGKLTWHEPNRTFTPGYFSESLQWDFVPHASYGAGALTVSGLTRYYASISNIDISYDKTVKVSGISNKYYTGKAQTQPNVKVVLNGKTLTKDRDYTVSYISNKNIGNAAVVIQGKGTYIGSITKTFKISPQKGAIYTTGGLTYKMTNTAVTGKGTVTLTGSTNKKMTSLTIKSTVKIGGCSFQITAVNANAFKGYTKLKTVTVGANVKTIGANAFYNCKNLKTLTIKSQKLTKVEKNAIGKIYKKAKITVPNKKYSAYKKLLKSSTGYKKTMKLKKS